MRILVLVMSLSACAPAASETVVVAMKEFSVPPGVEVYKCQNFSNPFGARAVDVDAFEAHIPAGGHHMIVFFVDGATDGPLEDCSGTEFHGNVFGAQTPDSEMVFPRGIGVAIPAKTGLRIQLHYVNASNREVVAGVTTQFHVAPPGSITQHAGQLIFSNQNIVIPPGTPTQVSKTCPVPNAISLIGASAHVHQHAVDFVAESGGQLLYQFAGGSEPVPARFDPPVALQAGQGVTFTCSYLNDTPNTITWGESAVSNEMCVFGAIYYPVADLDFPNLPCF